MAVRMIVIVMRRCLILPGQLLFLRIRIVMTIVTMAMLMTAVMTVFMRMIVIMIPYPNFNLVIAM